MIPTCSDVCERIHEELIGLGFKIDGNEEDHADMLEALDKTTFIKDNQLVFTATISHKYGISTYVSLTEDGLEEQIYDYVKEWWDQWENIPEMPKDKAKAIEVYFEFQNEYAGREWIDYSQTGL